MPVVRLGWLTAETLVVWLHAVTQPMSPFCWPFQQNEWQERDSLVDASLSMQPNGYFHPASSAGNASGRDSSAQLALAELQVHAGSRSPIIRAQWHSVPGCPVFPDTLHTCSIHRRIALCFPTTPNLCISSTHFFFKEVATYVLFSSKFMLANPCT